MNLRPSSRGSASESGEQPTTGTGRGSHYGITGLLRHALVALGLLAVTYLVARALEPIEDPSVPAPVEELGDQAVDAAPVDVSSSIAEMRERADDVAAVPIEALDPDDGETGDGEHESDTDPLEESKTKAEYTEEDRSEEEIAERTESDAQDEPAEPGEMTVDEDVAESLVDEGPGDDADEG